MGSQATVKAEGWRLFGERIAEARRILVAAEPLGRTCPLFYVMRLRAALTDGTSRENYDRLFEESVKAFPTYAPFYFVRVNYLLPRWHGEEGEWEAFAETSANQVGGMAGDILYARIVWRMHETRIFDNVFDESKMEWERAQRASRHCVANILNRSRR